VKEPGPDARVEEAREHCNMSLTVSRASRAWSRDSRVSVHVIYCHISSNVQRGVSARNS
jgi:hypothetical protein